MLFGEVICSYTRKQAIEDGVLIDVTKMAKEAGFKYPIAMTSAAWAKAVECNSEDLANGQDEKGRLWDVLQMLLWYIRMGQARGGQRIDFSVSVSGKIVRLYSLCGPGDNFETAITIMVPGED